MTTGLTYDEAVVIRNAIVPIHEHQKPSDKINLIYHTTPHRGLELLVPSFIEVVKQNPNIPLHLDVYSSFNVYGWSNRDLPYQPLFDMCKDHPNITYHGYQPNHVIRQALTKAHIFAYPNIWPETSSLAAIEAMSAGCLVIYPRFEGLIETVGDMGVSYSYCNDMQTHANRFASTLNQVVQIFGKNKHLDNLIQKAKIHTNTYYSWENRIDEWVSLYESILNNGKSN
jgi:UDP-glucose:(glucosyl)LPS alpha-1,2-glucosyltransferase